MGFSIRPPNHNIGNNQPYEPFEGEITPFQNIREDNTVQINRISGYAQFGEKLFWNNNEAWYNIGIRAQYWNVTGNGVTGKSQTIISPRAQFAIKPSWEKDMLFRMSGGWYSQPPSYRELRGFDGKVNIDVKAQKSIHLVLGMDYSFDMWDRPFKLTAEAYYKDLSNVNSYTIDNVRIRYRADNNATAYAHGLDLRLNGEFVPGSDSWVSLGYLKTEENINKRLFRARKKFRDGSVTLELLDKDKEHRVEAVCKVLYLLFNEGYFSIHHPDKIRMDLCYEAIRLLQQIEQTYCDFAQVKALMAIMMLSVPRTVGPCLPRRSIWSPTRPPSGAVMSIFPPSISMTAPIARSPLRWRSTGLSPMTHPPGSETLAFPRRARSGPITQMEARILRTSS